MEDLGFTPAEVNIFLSLKLRERTERLADLKVAVVECNPETLSQLSDQLRGLEGVELYSYLLSHVEAYPYNLGEEMDLVVTTVEHARLHSEHPAEGQKNCKNRPAPFTGQHGRHCKNPGR